MSACTFFGHRECYGLDAGLLKAAIETLIREGVEEFFVGNQGDFDAMVYGCLKQLRKVYPHIRIAVVLAYLPTEKENGVALSDTMYPEIEGHPKFSIDRRNRWLLEQASVCVCYVNHTWGGAYKFARLAKQRGKTVINIGNANIWQ